MVVIRKQEMVVNSVHIGDQIQVGKYTATCQKITESGGIFMLDQCLDKPYGMNRTVTNVGGYEASDLRKDLIDDFKTDVNFDSIRHMLVPFENGDLVRIPTIGEFFGQDNFYVMDKAKQWELMKNRSNRIADREGIPLEWSWLQNTVKMSAARFAVVGNTGLAASNSASLSLGVRPVFMLVA